ncbi:hypothetical protein ACFFX0_32645 [Citricoccus parietis]|uniref:Uncharacterized protein n=1 Tax=Citricoccus parietis TaxID=592307 RepID=A0ABV5G9R7_9MICC
MPAYRQRTYGEVSSKIDTRGWSPGVSKLSLQSPVPSSQTRSSPYEAVVPSPVIQ